MADFDKKDINKEPDLDFREVVPEEMEKKTSDHSEEKEYEEICFACRRPESKAGRMFHMPGGISICEDCMQKTMDALNQMDPGMMGGFPGMGGFPNMSGFPNMGGFPGMDGFFQTTPGKTENEDSQVVDADAVAEPDNEGSPADGSGTNEAQNAKSNASAENGKNQGQNASFWGNGFPNIRFVNLSDFQGDGIPNRQKLKKKKKNAAPAIDIRNIPAPHKIKAQLDEYVVGQEHAKKVISVAVYNHYKRIATGASAEVEIEKSNILLLGPTGCGKTYMVKTLAKLLDVPLAIADATSLTEAGYIGDDIESVISKLLAAADNDVERAEQGIVFIDEIDKIAKKKNTSSRDVSGESVQQGMLKLLEGSEVEVPVGANSKNAMVPLATVNTKNILFICGGAFPDLDEIIKQRLHKESSMGFNAVLKDDIDKEKDVLSKVKTEDLRKFGMIPEFLGRLPIICALKGLDQDMMVKVLSEPRNAILKQYQKLLEMDEVQLEFDDEALEMIAKKALEQDTGARALRSIIEEFMLDIMYEIPKDDNIGRVVITKEYIEGTGGPVIEIRSQSIERTELPGPVSTEDKGLLEGVVSQDV